MMHKYALVLFATLVTASNSSNAQESPNSAEPVQALLTDSFVINIQHPPEKVWAHIKQLYVDGDRYRQRGLEVSQIENDPTAFLGGLHAVSKPDAPTKTELWVRFSIIDDENRFVAMHMDGVLPRGIYISHDVSPSQDGSRYQVIIHAFMPVELTDGQPRTAEAVREWMTSRYQAHNEGLQAIVKKEVAEALDSK